MAIDPMTIPRDEIAASGFVKAGKGAVISFVRPSIGLKMRAHALA